VGKEAASVGSWGRVLVALTARGKEPKKIYRGRPAAVTGCLNATGSAAAKSRTGGKSPRKYVPSYHLTQSQLKLRTASTVVAGKTE